MSRVQTRISACIVALAASLTCWAAQAETVPLPSIDTQISTPPIYLLASTGAVPLLLPPAASDSRPAPPPSFVFTGQNTSRVRLLELPSEHRPGQYSRPRFALGLRSDAMKSWLNERGFAASVCMAPVVRMRSKMSKEGDWSGSVMLQARCSFY